MTFSLFSIFVFKKTRPSITVYIYIIYIYIYHISTIFRCNFLCILRTYLKNRFIILHIFNNYFDSFWFFQGIAFKLTWYVGIFQICISVALYNNQVISCLAVQEIAMCQCAWSSGYFGRVIYSFNSFITEVPIM